MLDFVDRIRDEAEVGVPRRLSVGALFVLLTFYSVLFRVLVVIGADARWTAITCLFFAAINLGQMVLFRGDRPRAASILVGALVCPAMLVAVVLDESLTQFTGWTPVANGLHRPAAFVSAILTLGMVGSLVGYLFGGMIAGVFYVVQKVRPGSVVARSDVDPAMAAGGDDRGAALLGFVSQWINPLQPGSPLHGAFAAFLLTVTFGCCVSAFVPWAWNSQVILFAAGLGILFALWTGNFQLWIFWPFALGSLGAVLAAWPMAAFVEIPRFRDWIGEPEVFRLWGRLLGVSFGLTIGAVAGWTQWSICGAARKGRLGFVPYVGFVVALVSIGWLVTNRLEAWAQSPTQQLFGKIQADGGVLGWTSMTGETLRWVVLGEGSGDEDLARLRPLLADGIAVDLRGRSFTNESISLLEGLHMPSLRLFNTSMTDDAFTELHDLSATSLHMTNVGDRGLAQLTAMPAMQQTLRSLTVNGTKITDAGLKHLAPCRALSELNLADCEISDDGLAILAAAAVPLEQLVLVRTDITDKGLVHLAQIKSLTEVRVNDTRITQAGIAALRMKLPKCTVIWHDE